MSLDDVNGVLGIDAQQCLRQLGAARRPHSHTSLEEVLNQPSNAWPQLALNPLSRDMVFRVTLFCGSLRGQLARLPRIRLAKRLQIIPPPPAAAGAHVSAA